MESVAYQKIKQIAADYDEALLASDPRFRRSVSIIHEDGSSFHFDSAFLMSKDEWIICFSEHYGFHIYSADELMAYWQTVMVHDPIEELP